MVSSSGLIDSVMFVSFVFSPGVVCSVLCLFYCVYTHFADKLEMTQNTTHNPRTRHGTHKHKADTKLVRCLNKKNLKYFCKMLTKAKCIIQSYG